MSWLWRSDTSAATFEKALAKLSGQISSASAALDKSRSRSRRAKALWTLYTTLTYLISALILVLVIGPQDWELPHYGGLVAGPLIIFSVRKAITAVSGWSIARQQSHVERLQKQREEKINELKKATKYDSTQELLQKYGGAPATPKQDVKQDQKDRTGAAKPNQQQSPPQKPVQRTGLPPPPTANIQHRHSVSHASNPSPAVRARSPTSPPEFVQSPVAVEEPGFAPNAFTQQPASFAAPDQNSHWYDRILDVMLGEDENLAKNRLVLLCQNCRLVNGQAPPGVKTLEELGRWRCQSCGSWNGVQAEAAKVVQDMTKSQSPASPVVTTEKQTETTLGGDMQALDEQSGSTGREQDETPSNVSKRVTRSIAKAEAEEI